MENPRILLSAFIDQRIAGTPGQWSPDRREHGQLQDFLERLGAALDRADIEPGVRNLAGRVRFGHKPIPRHAVKAWAKALRLHPGAPDFERFQELVDASRLWGKKDGRSQYARMETQLSAMRDQIAALARELQESESRRIQLEAAIIKRDSGR